MRIKSASLALLGIIVIAFVILIIQNQTIKSLNSESSLLANEAKAKRPPAAELTSARSERATAPHVADASPKRWPVDTKQERLAFLKRMRKDIQTQDVGVVTFIPTPEIGLALDGFTAEELKTLLEEIPGMKYNFSIGSFLTSNLLNRLVFLDPEFAVEFGQKAGKPSYGSIIKSGLRHWAAKDPKAALEWLESQEKWDDPWWRKELYATYAHGVSPSDIQGALTILDDVQDDKEVFSRVLSEIALAASDADSRQAVLDYIEMLDPELAQVQRAKLVHNILYREGFEAAAAYFEELGERLSGEKRNETIVSLATQEVTEKGIDKAKWLLEQSTPGQRAANVKRFAEKWISQDYNGATAWIDAMKAGRGRDVAIEELVRQVSSFDGRGARVWAEQIEDPAARKRALAEADRHHRF